MWVGRSRKNSEHNMYSTIIILVHTILGYSKNFVEFSNLDQVRGCIKS